MKCLLCPRQCNAERNETAGSGYCKMPSQIKIARAALHFDEEPCISGTNGSGTVFFSGCPLSCVFCQNYGVSHNGYGKTVTVNRLAQIFGELEEKGAHNINLVTPSHYAAAIREALDIYRPKIPIVYNSSGYETVETLKMLDGYIDIFLLDFKYISPEKAKKYSHAENYPEFAEKALAEANRQAGECVFKGEIMQKGIIVRHLLMPGGTNDAIKIYDLARQIAPNAYFSIMSQYMPCGKAEMYPEINRKITKREYEKVLLHITDSGYEKVYFQERSSSDERYIPDFSCQGV